jgi:hypothetical protein
VIVIREAEIGECWRGCTDVSHVLGWILKKKVVKVEEVRKMKKGWIFSISLLFFVFSVNRLHFFFEQLGYGYGVCVCAV